MINSAYNKIIKPIVRKSLFSLALIFALSFVLAILLNLWGNFKQSLAQTQETLTLESRLLERSITRTLESVESAVVSIESTLATENLLLEDPTPLALQSVKDVLRKNIDQILHFAPHIRQIVVTEGSRILLDSTSRYEGSDIDFLQIGLDVDNTDITFNNAGLAFFSTTQSRFLPLADQNPIHSPHSIFITGTRTGSMSASGEAYWILVALNPDYFVDFFLSESSVAHSSRSQNVNIIDFNGDSLVSLMAHFTEVPPIESFLQSGHNQQYFSTQSAVHSLTLLSRYPLIVAVSKQRTAIMSLWWKQNYGVFVWLSALMFLLVMSGLLLFIQFRRRLLIQNQMAALTRALDQSQAAIILTDNFQQIEYVNSSVEHMFGYDAAALLGRNPRILASGETDIDIIHGLKQALHTGEHWQGELVNRTLQGKLITVNTHISAVVDESGSISHYVAVIDDITARREAEDALQLAASVFSTAHEGILITDTRGNVIDVNESFTRITGFSRNDILGKNPRILSSGIQDEDFYTQMWRDLFDKGCWFGEIWNRRKNGEVYAEMLSISAVKNTQGVVQHYVAMFSDITSIREYQDRLEHIAHFDVLTSLPNRVLLSDRLHQAMIQAKRNGLLLAVVFLDLDGFKSVNDHYGHDSGDELLKVLSQRMKNTLRSGDTLARIGGDEFVAVLLDLPNIKTCEPMLTRLLSTASEPVYIAGSNVQVSASLGVTFYPQEENLDADQLQRQADQAMYQAKLAGKNRYHVFDTFHDRSRRSHLEKVDHIIRGFTDHEFVLHYQPKVNMRNGEVVGAEALIRWQHPQKGLLAPAEFLPIIEDHPLAIDLGEWVINAALTQIELWRSAGLDLPVSVNIGALQLQHPDFIERLKSLLDAHPSVPAHRLEIEVLETSALEDIEIISGVIEACRELGVAFALDDFGTGYSSLTYLKRLSVKILKIDKSFVREMLYDPDDLSILEGVIGLANAFRRAAVAEGVETIEHGEMLLQLGCEIAQGYGIARPMPAEQMLNWIDSWITPSIWKNCSQLNQDLLKVLRATVEHRAWVIAIERYLNGECSIPPQVDQSQCGFGKWLFSERKVWLNAQSHFSDIDEIHQQLHFLWSELYHLHEQGFEDEALARLDELYHLRDDLINKLHDMLRSPH